MTEWFKLFGAVVLIAAVQVPVPAWADACAGVKRELTYGRVALKQAEDKAGFLKSAKEFEAATVKAPDYDLAHFNKGLVYEKAGEYAKAKSAMEKYLQLSPQAADSAKVQEKIYELEYLAREQAGAAGGAPGTPSGLGGFSGKWCDVSSCDHPQWGSPERDFQVTMSRGNIVIAQKFRARRGSYADDQHAIFEGTVRPDGKIRGIYSEGATMVTNPQCRGRTFEDKVDFTGELKKDSVIDTQGRTISGGAIILRYRKWSAHNFNYGRCTLDRDPKMNWMTRTLILKQRG